MNIFSGIDLVNQGINASLTRKSLISQNISNVDTPYYKRQDINFESALEKALAQGKNIQAIDLNDLEVKPYTDHSISTYRMDGNNVDIQIEKSEEAKVEMRYNALVTRITAQLNRFTSTLQNLK